jgi:hypothetical protein
MSLFLGFMLDMTIRLIFAAIFYLVVDHFHVGSRADSC